MAQWQDVERETPELAAKVRRSFDANKHKTMATLRKDGAPRISGTELDFTHDGLFFGSMWGAVKARDLQRDPRIALHSATIDPELVLGDAKISGRAIELTDDAVKAAYVAERSEAGNTEQPPEPWHLFRVDVDELVWTGIGDPADHLVIESWHEGRGTRRIERR